MNREQRYIVFKIADVNNAMSYEEQQTLQVLADSVERYRERAGKHQMECVVVESDWPEYEAVWKMIADRVDGVAPIPTETVNHWLARALQLARSEITKQVVLGVIDSALLAAEQAKPAPELTDDGMMLWSGGKCPVGHGVFVRIKMRNGEFAEYPGTAVGWSVTGRLDDVIAYSVIERDCDSAQRL